MWAPAGSFHCEEGTDLSEGDSPTQSKGVAGASPGWPETHRVGTSAAPQDQNGFIVYDNLKGRKEGRCLGGSRRKGQSVPDQEPSWQWPARQQHLPGGASPLPPSLRLISPCPAFPQTKSRGLETTPGTESGPLPSVACERAQRGCSCATPGEASCHLWEQTLPLVARQGLSPCPGPQKLRRQIWAQVAEGRLCPRA